jgi:D-alanyl-D-alanine carboxypeptidase/D-alanyl-D-alanine-endopeptidase (penicillin-binding protein 4)
VESEGKSWVHYPIFRVFIYGIVSVWGISLLVMLGGCAARRVGEPVGHKPVVRQIGDILEATESAGTHWGIRVETVEGELVYGYRDRIRVVPASTVKLLTTASALVLLGPDYRIPTEFLVDGYIDTGGVLQGDLVIKGYGDPALAALDQLETVRLADQWSDTLRQRGLDSIAGEIWGDGMAVDPRGSRRPWEKDDLFHTYGAKVSALSIAENSVRVCVTPSGEWCDTSIISYWPASAPVRLHNNVKTAPIAHFGIVSAEPAFGDPYESWRIMGVVSNLEKPIYQSIPLERPEALFLAVAAEGLNGKGINVSGGIGGFRNPKTQVSYNGNRFPSRCYAYPYRRDTLYVHWSPPLSDIIKGINSPSHNLGAEILIRHMGWRKGGRGEFRKGKAVACRWMASAGLDTTVIAWIDGSGLSRRNLLSPDWVVQLLQVMAHHPYAEDFHESLAVMGQRGTLECRSADTPLAGNIWAKTGTMSGLSCISGYMQTKRRTRLVFSIMVNGSTEYLGHLLNAQDQILAVLYQSI